MVSHGEGSLENPKTHMIYKWTRPNKKISVFRVTGLKILGRVRTHIFLIIFFLEKNIILYAF